MKNLENLFESIVFGNVNDVYGFESTVIFATDGYINNTLIKGFAGRQKRKATMETKVFDATYLICVDYETKEAKLYINSEKEANSREAEVILKYRQLVKLVDSTEISKYMESRLDHFKENTISFLEWED